MPHEFPMVPSARRASRIEIQNELRRCVKQILVTQSVERSQIERRREARFAFPYAIRLWPEKPVAETGERPTRVLGRFISAGGLDFYHSEPLTDRRVIADFAVGGHRGAAVRLLLELRWCRFGRHGLYEHGGRFLRVMDAGSDD